MAGVRPLLCWRPRPRPTLTLSRLLSTDSWPPHLPHPGLMDHLAQVFLNSVPVVHGLFHPGRFLTRLSLPPSHTDFPHPAILHAICAVSARYTAYVSLLLDAYSLCVADLTLFAHPYSVVQVAPPDRFKPQLTRSAAERLAEKPLPTSDGLGQLADGADDFATIHAKWAQIYFQSSIDHPSEWHSLVIAAILLAVYSHSAGLLVETWQWIGHATRLAIPLGLNTDSKRTSPGPQLSCPGASSVVRMLKLAFLLLMS